MIEIVVAVDYSMYEHKEIYNLINCMDIPTLSQQIEEIMDLIADLQIVHSIQHLDLLGSWL